MNVKEHLTSLLIRSGLFESQAKEIIELAIPVLDKESEEINGMAEIDGKPIPENPYFITWDAPSSDYPDALYRVWFNLIKPIALKWIDQNKPQAWFREMFV